MYVFVTFPCTVYSQLSVPKHPEFSCNQQIFKRKCSIFIKLFQRYSCDVHMFTCQVTVPSVTISINTLHPHAGLVIVIHDYRRGQINL